MSSAGLLEVAGILITVVVSLGNDPPSHDGSSPTLGAIAPAPGPPVAPDGRTPVADADVTDGTCNRSLDLPRDAVLDDAWLPNEPRDTAIGNQLLLVDADGWLKRPRDTATTCAGNQKARTDVKGLTASSPISEGKPKESGLVMWYWDPSSIEPAGGTDVSTDPGHDEFD